MNIFNKINKKHNLKSEDNSTQYVCKTLNPDIINKKAKRESINIIINNCSLSLTKWEWDDTKMCNLSYVDSSKKSLVSISLSQFDTFYNRLKAIIADWNAEYHGDKDILWKLDIDVDESKKQINGNGSSPENWNAFIYLLSDYEILYKEILASSKNETEVKIDSSFKKFIENKEGDSSLNG